MFKQALILLYYIKKKQLKPYLSYLQKDRHAIQSTLNINREQPHKPADN